MDAPNPSGLRWWQLTLIWMLAPILIAGFLVAYFQLLSFRYSFGDRSSPETIAEQIVQSSFTTPIEVYRLHLGRFPSTETGLAGLQTNLDGPDSGWKGPYISNSYRLDDPWANPFQYRGPGIHNPDTYDLWS